MALQKQNAVFPMVKGMDTKTDPKQLVTGKMELLQNAVFTSPLQYQKRYGYSSLGSLDNPRSLFSFNEEVLAFANNKIYSYSPGLDDFITIKNPQDQTSDLEFEPINISSFEAISNSESHYACCSAYHSSGVQGVVSNTGSNLYFTIIDYESKANLYGPIAFGGALVTSPKVYVISNLFIVIYNDGTSLFYRAIPVNTTSGALPSAVSINTNFDTSGSSLDACVSDGMVYVVWGIGGPGIGIAKIDSSLTVIKSTLVVVDTLSNGVGICTNTTSLVSSGTLSVAYYNGTDVKYIKIDANFNIVVSPVTVETIASVITVCPIIDDGDGYVYYEVQGSNPGSGLWYNNLVKRAIITSNALTSTAVFLRSVGIASKPFTATVNDEEITCIMVGYTGSQPAPGQGTQFIVNESKVVIGKMYPGNCYGVGPYTQVSSTPFNSPAEVNQISTGIFISSFLRATFFYNLGTDAAPLQISGFGVFGLTIDFTESAKFPSAVAASNIHIAAGILEMYDGKDFVEHNFNLFPEKIVSATESYNGSTNNFPTGVYKYVVVPEWIDSQGNLHQGSPSPVLSKSITGPQTQVALVIPTLRITQKSGVYLSPFRTLVDGSVYYRVGATVSAGAASSVSADTVTFNDTSTDATISVHDQLYTTGGDVENESTPSPLIVANYNNRLVVIPRETSSVIWISKSILQGIPAFPVNFSGFLTIQVNTLGGDITAFIQMDAYGVIFKESSIFVMSGAGPNDTLTTNDISTPTQVPTDVGCVDSASVVSTPFGTMFKSLKGIYLLERSLQVNYIGADVEDYNNETIVSADLIPDTQQVRFLLDNGICLVFDYYVKEWSIFTNHSGVDAVIYNGAYTYLNSDGNLLTEDQDTFLDNGVFYPMKLTTGWLSFAGIQGFQRVWKMEILGHYYSSHRLQVSLAYNFNPNVEQTVSFNPGSIYDNDLYGESTPYGDEDTYGSEYPLEQFVVYPDIQKCESIQVTIEDVSNSVDGQCLSLSSLGFEVGVEGGLNRLPSSNKFG